MEKIQRLFKVVSSKWSLGPRCFLLNRPKQPTTRPSMLWSSTKSSSIQHHCWYSWLLQRTQLVQPCYPSMLHACWYCWASWNYLSIKNENRIVWIYMFVQCTVMFVHCSVLDIYFMFICYSCQMFCPVLFNCLMYCFLPKFLKILIFYCWFSLFLTLCSMFNKVQTRKL